MNSILRVLIFCDKCRMSFQTDSNAKKEGCGAPLSLSHSPNSIDSVVTCLQISVNIFMVTIPEPSNSAGQEEVHPIC